MSKTPIWVVIPAAGKGDRFGSEVPKQYLPLGGRPVLEHTLARFEGLPRLAGVVVALAANDRHFQGITVPEMMRVHAVTGGIERMDSVRAGLDWLLAGGEAHAGDWVLVHDAARPLLPRADLDRLVAACDGGAEGALLALPISDTVKHSANGEAVESTIARDGLWCALTPQMFRLGALRDAMHAAREAGLEASDEAMVMEHAGIWPRMVTGSSCNIKITRPEDQRLAEALLLAERR